MRLWLATLPPKWQSRWNELVYWKTLPHWEAKAQIEAEMAAERKAA